jgi:hypothetical protein
MHRYAKGQLPLQTFMRRKARDLHKLLKIAGELVQQVSAAVSAS